MGRVFIDANAFIDILENRCQISLSDFEDHDSFLSPLSAHIYVYLYKCKIPNNKLAEFLKAFILVDFDNIILNKALIGPTADFEDNVQLHSAAEAECDFFITNDQKLLNMKFFGKIQIVQELE